MYGLQKVHDRYISPAWSRDVVRSAHKAHRIVADFSHYDLIQGGSRTVVSRGFLYFDERLATGWQ